MAFVAVDQDMRAHIYKYIPTRFVCGKNGKWVTGADYVPISREVANKLVGKHITWDDAPMEVV